MGRADFEGRAMKSERRHARQERRSHLKLWAFSLLVTAALFLLALQLMGPAPPKHLVLAAGPRDGVYFARAREYARRLARDGIQVQVRVTAGSIENLHRLRTGEVDLGFVQGGTASKEDRAALGSIASVFLEPLWVFTRSSGSGAGLKALRTGRIAIGAEGSGTQALARELLRTTGFLTPGGPASTARLRALGGSQAARALLAGEVDSAFFVVAPGAAYLKDLLASADLSLLTFPRQDALVRRRRYLADVYVPRGLFDLAADLPPRDLHLLAPTAALVGRKDLHPAVPALLIEAARAFHEGGSLLAAPDRFPSAQQVDVPLNEDARRYFARGPSWIYRVFPFRIASFLDRAIFLLLPLLTILFPFLKTAPPLYRWGVRRRIYRWYRGIRAVDRQTYEQAPAPALQEAYRHLERIEQEVAQVSIPLSYMEEFYNLRLHLDFVMRRLRERLVDPGEEAGRRP